MFTRGYRVFFFMTPIPSIPSVNPECQVGISPCSWLIFGAENIGVTHQVLLKIARSSCPPSMKHPHSMVPNMYIYIYYFFSYIYIYIYIHIYIYLCVCVFIPFIPHGFWEPSIWTREGTRSYLYRSPFIFRAHPTLITIFHHIPSGKQIGNGQIHLWTILVMTTVITSILPSGNLT